VKGYAAFVMTYQRPAILQETVKALFAQSLPPSKVLIVDNDLGQSAKAVAGIFGNDRLSYYPVGYNSGPAGASYWGCKLLYEEGWEWVLWVDDDDPPVFPDTLERIFQMAEVYDAPEKIGILGAVGVKFNPRLGKTIRLKDEDLCGIQEVDNIAGNQFPIIHRRVFEHGIFPNPDLFFGFEELEFNLRVKDQGLSVLVGGELLKRMRVKAGRLGFKRGLYASKKGSQLYREYYTARNLSYILKQRGHFLGLLSFSFKGFLKAVLGFRYGLEYGKKNYVYTINGLLHGWRGKLGIRYLPVKKT